MFMKKENFKNVDGVFYDVTSYSNDKITLERMNENSKMKYVLECENYNDVGKNIVQILSNQYIKRLANLTQLNK